MKNRYPIIFAIIDTTIFKVAILLVLFGACYATIQASQTMQYFASFLAVMTNFNFTVIFFMTAILLATYITITTFEKNTVYIIRLQNKKQYIKELIKTVIGVNTILFIIMILSILMGLNIFNRFSFAGEYTLYKIPIVLYSLFFSFRFYILILLFAVANTCLWKFIHPSILVIMNILLFAFIFAYAGPSVSIVQNIIDTPIFMGGYLSNYPYSSFSFEIICTVLYCLGYLFCIIILYYITIKRIKRIGD